MNVDTEKRVSTPINSAYFALGMAAALCIDRRSQEHLEDLKMRAAEVASRAFAHIAKERESRGLDFIKQDLGKTGLIGCKASSITTDRGYLSKKRVTLNPNFSALIVKWLQQINVRPGENVAVAISGSFPALNICVYSALFAMRIAPMIVTSVGSSNWGANDLAFCWLDMEKSLCDADILPFRSDLASIGGNGDCGRNMAQGGADWSRDKIISSGIPFLKCSDTPNSIELRMAFYREKAGDRPIRAYINVGGGVASVSKREKALLTPGLNLQPARAVQTLSDSVMQRMGRQNIPLIHLVMVNDLAEQYRLGKQEDGVPAKVGEGSMY